MSTQGSVSLECLASLERLLRERGFNTVSLRLLLLYSGAAGLPAEGLVYPRSCWNRMRRLLNARSIEGLCSLLAESGLFRVSESEIVSLWQGAAEGASSTGAHGHDGASSAVSDTVKRAACAAASGADGTGVGVLAAPSAGSPEVPAAPDGAAAGAFFNKVLSSDDQDVSLSVSIDDVASSSPAHRFLYSLQPYRPGDPKRGPYSPENRAIEEMYGLLARLCPTAPREALRPYLKRFIDEVLVPHFDGEVRFWAMPRRERLQWLRNVLAHRSFEEKAAALLAPLQLELAEAQRLAAEAEAAQRRERGAALAAQLAAQRRSAHPHGPHEWFDGALQARFYDAPGEGDPIPIPPSAPDRPSPSAFWNNITNAWG